MIPLSTGFPGARICRRNTSAVSHGKDLSEAGFCDGLPQRDQSFLYEAESRRPHGSGMDCLVPGIGEIIGGSQREEDYGKLLRRMEELSMDPAEYGFYLDLRKYGTTRHAGFGLGFERCISVSDRHRQHPGCDSLSQNCRNLRILEEEFMKIIHTGRTFIWEPSRIWDFPGAGSGGRTSGTPSAVWWHRPGRSGRIFC